MVREWRDGQESEVGPFPGWTGLSRFGLVRSDQDVAGMLSFIHVR